MADANLIKGAADMYAGGYQSIGKILDPVFKNIQDALETGIQRREEEERKERETYEGSSNLEAGYHHTWGDKLTSVATALKNIYGENTIGKGKAEAGSQQWHDYNNSALKAEANIKKLNAQVKTYGAAMEEWQTGVESGEISKFMSDKDRRWMRDLHAGKIIPEYDEESGNLYFERDGERVLIKDLPTPEVATEDIMYNKLVNKAERMDTLAPAQLEHMGDVMNKEYSGAGGERKLFDHIFGEGGSLTEVYSSLLGAATEGSSNTTENAMSASDKIIGFFKNPSGEEYKNLREHIKEKYGKDIGTTSGFKKWHVEERMQSIRNMHDSVQAARKSKEEKGKINEGKEAFDKFQTALAENTKNFADFTDAQLGNLKPEEEAKLFSGIAKTISAYMYGLQGKVSIDTEVADGKTLYAVKMGNNTWKTGNIGKVLRILQGSEHSPSAGETTSTPYDKLGKEADSLSEGRQGARTEEQAADEEYKNYATGAGL